MDLIGADERKRIDGRLAVLLARTLRAPDVDGTVSHDGTSGGANDDSLDAFRALLTRHVMLGGKRLRPQLCVWTYDRLTDVDRGGGAEHPAESVRDDAALYDLACAWELFHAFLLVHDDIIDAADRRRGEPSLHRRLQSLDSDSLRFGTNLGIVAGDLLYSAAMRLFHEADLPPQTYRRALRLFSRVATVTGMGQAVDICQAHVPAGEVREATLMAGYHWKTAAYTFEGPMLTAAVLAGTSGGVETALRRFALSLGQAYQLHNDLIDLATPVHPGCDLVQGKRTLTLVRYRATLDVTDQADLDTSLAEAAACDLVAAERLRRRLIDGKAADATADMIRHFLSDAADAASTPDLPPRLADGLNGLLTRLADSYFAGVHFAGFVRR